MRLFIFYFVLLNLVGCDLAQSERFVVKDTSSGLLIFPPGPLPEGNAEVIIPGVIDLTNSRSCEKVELQVGAGKIGTRLFPSFGLRSSQQFVVTIDQSIRKDKQAVTAAIDAYINSYDLSANIGPFACLKNGSIPLIKSFISDAIPSSYEDTLKKTFGLDTETKSVEVLPGQSFCVEYADGRFRQDRGGAAEGRQFFSGGTKNCYRLELGAGGRPTNSSLTFSTFFRAIGGINVADTDSNRSSRSAYSRRVAGTVDLLNTQSVRDKIRYRLFYNDTIPSFNDVSPPSYEFNQTPLLISTSCPGSMEYLSWLEVNDRAKICMELVSERDLNQLFVPKLNEFEKINPLSAVALKKCVNYTKDGLSEWKPVCYLFNERGIPFPQVDILINGEPSQVEIYQTLWNILEQSGTLRYERLLHEGVSATAVSEVMQNELSKLHLLRRHNGRIYPVFFETINIQALQLPLLPGDEVFK
ncbi:hypothetical protein L1D51_12285 [Pseudoalteromonas shioyasakiensis]|uniref:hypothetical protein n=1 Tax=Pseudoalteromonas shioyasakiensis TaxID=1190813 RepID=UPI001EFE68B6|nr:hypothetical protein [Pseudoalteromonas shioyasakiensis]MCG9734772.1 hypothetical protein [Pseudoalteromonas shioyasakiensis]